MAGDLNSIVFEPENSVGIGKIAQYFAVRIGLFGYLSVGTKI